MDYKNTLIFNEDGSINRPLLEDINSNSNTLDEISNILLSSDIDFDALSDFIRKLASNLHIDHLDLYVTDEKKLKDLIRVIPNPESLDALDSQIHEHNRKDDLTFIFDSLSLYVSQRLIDGLKEGSFDSKEVSALIAYELISASRGIVKFNSLGNYSITYKKAEDIKITIDGLDEGKLDDYVLVVTSLLSIMNRSLDCTNFDYIASDQKNNIALSCKEVLNDYGYQNHLNTGLLCDDRNSHEDYNSDIYINLEDKYSFFNKVTTMIKELKSIPSINSKFSEVLKQHVYPDYKKASEYYKSEDLSHEYIPAKVIDYKENSSLEEAYDRYIKEDVFFGRSGKTDSMLKNIEAEFQSIVDTIKPKGDKYEITMPKSERSRKMKSIAGIANKLFNINLSMEMFDVYPLQSGAYTVLDPRFVNDINREINWMIVSREKGMKMFKASKMKVAIETGLLLDFYEHNQIVKKGKNSKLDKIGHIDIAKLCTGILLHELGHNMMLYIYLDYFQEKGPESGKVEISMGKNDGNIQTFKLPIDEKVKDLMDASNDNATAYIVSAVVTLFFMATAYISNNPKHLLGSLVAGISQKFFDKKNDKYNDRIYDMVSEMSANYLPTVYGYSDILSKFYSYVSVRYGIKPYSKISISGFFSRIKRIFSRVEDNGYDIIELNDSMIQHIEFEIKNKNNTPEQIAVLKNQLKELQKSKEIIGTKR